MRVILLILIFNTISTVKADVITSYFYSDALGYDMYYQIVLPPSYESNPDSTYPSIYFLHGFGLDYSWYGSVVSVFEDMMASGEIRESILVKPDGFVTPYLGSMYTNSDYNGQLNSRNYFKSLRPTPVPSLLKMLYLTFYLYCWLRRAFLVTNPGTGR